MEFRVHFIDDMTFALYQGRKLVRIFRNLAQLEHILDCIDNKLTPKFLRETV